jgi:hypothetical protein
VNHISDTATTVTVLAAGLAALGYLGRRIARAFRALEALQRVVDHELTHNHGTSIKDDTHGTAIAAKKTADAVDGLRRDLAAILYDGLGGLREDLTEVRERLDRLEQR